MGVGDRVEELSAGDLLMLQPGQDHVLLRASADLELFVMALTPELEERCGARQQRASGLRARLAGSELPELRERLCQLGQLRDGMAAEQRVSELFAQAQARVPACHVVSRRALQSVAEAPELGAAGLARRFNTSTSQLSRHFPGDVGVTLVEYRSRLRLMKFIDLADRGMSFTAAALGAEFGSYAQCSRVFKRLLGHAPGEYFSGARALVDAATL
jgi:AraC-like DNA-binding protein